VTDSKDKQRKSDDRFALAAVIIGGTMAFLTRRDPMGLGTGLALGLAGAILALRGERNIGGKGWLQAALMIALAAFLSRIGLEMYQEWVVAQWFAEGTGGMATQNELQRMTEVATGLRITALASSLALLLGAAVHRMK
jgi:hypothetical protein